MWDFIYRYLPQIIYVFHIFIHSSVHRHLDCLYILAIVSNVTINMGGQISLQDDDFISFKYVIRSRIYRSYGSSIFIFLRVSILFSILQYQFTFPPTVYKDSLFSTSWTMLCCLFDNRHTSRCGCGFDLHFLD